jgi:hypothetical protein
MYNTKAPSFIKIAILAFIFIFPLALDAEDISITLKAQATGLSANEVVSFGLPFAPGAFTDLNQLVVLDESSNELAVYVEELVPWRGQYTGIRSVLVQFTMDFTGSRTRTVTVRTGTGRSTSPIAKTPVVNTLTGPAAEAIPRILALMPAQYLCDSWVAGPLVPMAENTGTYKNYESYFGGEFLGWGYQDREGGCCNLNGSASETEGWLFDRVTTVYRGYLRMGSDFVIRRANYAPHSNWVGPDTLDGERVLATAYRYANMYRDLLYDSVECVGVTNSQDACRGLFELKNPDVLNNWLDAKYSYTECSAIHYLLTGDERFLTSIRDVADMWNESNGGWFSIEYDLGRAWTERHFGFGWLANLHSWEILGRAEDSLYMMRCVDAIVDHINNPPDGWPADGIWRHLAHDHQEWGFFALGASPWMASVVLDAVFRTWLMTNEARLPQVAIGAADWLDVNGVSTEPWNTSDTCPFYFAAAANLVGETIYYPGGNNWDAGNEVLQPSTQGDGFNTQHNIEMLYNMSMGHWFGGRNTTYIQDRFRQMFEGGLRYKRNYPMRLYNWVLRNTSTFLLFIDPDGPTPEELRSVTVGLQRSEDRNQRTEGLQLTVSQNPFHKQANIRLRVTGYGLRGNAEKIRLAIYNAKGELVENLPLATRNSQLVTNFNWNASNQPAGLYIVKMQVGEKFVTRRLMLVR